MRVVSRQRSRQPMCFQILLIYYSSSRKKVCTRQQLPSQVWLVAQTWEHFRRGSAAPRNGIALIQSEQVVGRHLFLYTPMYIVTGVQQLGVEQNKTKSEVHALIERSTFRTQVLTCLCALLVPHQHTHVLFAHGLQSGLYSWSQTVCLTHTIGMQGMVSPWHVTTHTPYLIYEPKNILEPNQHRQSIRLIVPLQVFASEHILRSQH